jgi:hypothetical protein
VVSADVKGEEMNTNVKTRRGNFAVDGGGNWYFDESPDGCWLEIDVKEHAGCAYVCMAFGADSGGGATPYGEKLAGIIEAWA